MGVVAGTLGLIDAEVEKAVPAVLRDDKDKAGDLAGVEVRGGGGTATAAEVDWTAFEAETSPVDEVGHRAGAAANTVDKFEF